MPALLVLAAVADEAERVAELPPALVSDEEDSDDGPVVIFSVAGLSVVLLELAAPELPLRKSVTYQPEPLS